MAEKSYLEKYLSGKKIAGSRDLSKALTHKSAGDSHYERVEFLGDSVLGLVISDYLFRKYPALDVGAISRIKGYLVSKEVLYLIGRENNVPKLINTGSALSKKEIRNNKKIISDVLESVIGAVYLVRGFEEAGKLIHKLYGKRLKTAAGLKDFGDYKSELQKKLLALDKSLPVYTVDKTEGQEHNKMFFVACLVDGQRLGSGQGKTIKEAEQAAAKMAMKKKLLEAKK